MTLDLHHGGNGFSRIPAKTLCIGAPYMHANH
jgi:hypothetical protein